MVEFVNAPKLTLAEWQRKMENLDGYGSVAAWFNKYVVIDPDAVTPVGDGTYIRGIRLRTSADTQPTIEEYLMEREQLKLDKDGFDSTNL